MAALITSAGGEPGRGERSFSRRAWTTCSTCAFGRRPVAIASQTGSEGGRATQTRSGSYGLPPHHALHSSCAHRSCGDVCTFRSIEGSGCRVERVVDRFGKARSASRTVKPERVGGVEAGGG